ncbi:MAG: DUF2344 domain-containing protein [Eubacteriaceae bacterium]|nr:DUF2344 domain-containing protein [Eubacteriaceae bacterium]
MYTARMKFKKGEEIKYISHLDMQRMLQRTLRRAGVPIKYSEGFNPHPKLSFAMAMAVGMTSDCEYADIELEEYIDPEEFVKKANKSAPQGFIITKALVTEDNIPSLTSLVGSAEYILNGVVSEHGTLDLIQSKIQMILEKESITIRKRNKKGKMGIKEIRPMIYTFQATSEEDGMVSIRCSVATGSKENLRPDVLIDLINEDELLIDKDKGMGIHRVLLGNEEREELL